MSCDIKLTKIICKFAMGFFVFFFQKKKDQDILNSAISHLKWLTELTVIKASYKLSGTTELKCYLRWNQRDTRWSVSVVRISKICHWSVTSDETNQWDTLWSVSVVLISEI